MELKKHPKANLEKKRIRYFQIGLVIVLFLVLIVFEYRIYKKDVVALGSISFEAEFEEDIEKTPLEKKNHHRQHFYLRRLS